MNVPKEVEFFMRSLYRAEKKFMEIKEGNYPNSVVNKIKENIDSRKERLGTRFGLTYDDYLSWVDDNQLDVEAELINDEKMETCYHFLRALQDSFKRGDDYALCPYSKEKENSCGFCKNCVPVTEEQYIDYLHGYDIDTKEKLF
jgi:hypothetical protein